MKEQVISHFRIYDQIDLQKSVTSIKGKGTKEEPYSECFIEGRCLNMIKDASGERPIVPLMDWSYFDKQGFIKAEHDPTTKEIDPSKGTVKITTIPSFTNHIGVPIERKQTPDGKGCFIKAGLFAHLDKTKEVIELMKALDQWNQRHPDNLRTLGWSIEGDYIKKSANGDYIGKVYNVVLSSEPQDETTYAQFVEENNYSLAKSLEAGYATEPQKKIGGGALRRESLIGANSNQQFKEKKAMYKTEYDVYRACLAKGMDKDKAKAEAKKIWKEQKEKQKEEAVEMEKSISSLQDFCKSAISEIDTFQKSISSVPDELVQFDMHLKKSLQDANNGVEIDGVKAFIEQGQQLIETRNEQRAIGAQLAKSISSLMQVQESVISLLKSLNETAMRAEEQAAAATERTTYLTTRIQKSNTVLATDLSTLAGIPVDTQPNETPEELIKSIPGKKIEDYLIDKGINSMDKSVQGMYFKLQEDFRRNGLKAIPVEIQNEIVKLYNPSVSQ